MYDAEVEVGSPEVEREVSVGEVAVPTAEIVRSRLRFGALVDPATASRAYRYASA